jgi:hypothetical protein
VCGCVAGVCCVWYLKYMKHEALPSFGPTVTATFHHLLVNKAGCRTMHRIVSSDYGLHQMNA